MIDLSGIIEVIPLILCPLLILASVVLVLSSGLDSDVASARQTENFNRWIKRPLPNNVAPGTHEEWVAWRTEIQRDVPHTIQSSKLHDLIHDSRFTGENVIDFIELHWSEISTPESKPSQEMIDEDIRRQNIEPPARMRVKRMLKKGS